MLSVLDSNLLLEFDGEEGLNIMEQLVGWTFSHDSRMPILLAIYQRVTQLRPDMMVAGACFFFLFLEGGLHV